MLEVTAQDISVLNDTDLRLLIGYLCEAEVSNNNLTPHGVTYGGHQNAQDGGIDVRVSYDTKNWKEGFIPKMNTGFQVKKPTMPPSAIPEEMAPQGVLRESIKNLVKLKGAYIIISSQSSTADSALSIRKEKMREVLDSNDLEGEIILDFYDSQRIATWVNTFASLIAWVRRKVGRDLEGWKGYGNWAHSPGGINEDYLIDENARFVRKGNNSESMSIEKGLDRLRSELRKKSSIVRLVGLSGVGKTRFVQALFDERVGNKSLENSLVLYTDIGDNPTPSPKQIIEQLTFRSNKTYLIVDNCPPELHKDLTNILKASGAENISLLTIEYDVKDETSEETEVYLLEKASENVITDLIIKRYEQIDNKSARHVAELSGGNFRIANALASVINRGEDVSLLSDETIFSRLFEQRNERNNNLEVVAEVCSLVYSFNIDTNQPNNTELKLLSELAEMSDREFLRNVIELENRDLIQKRGVFRAFLPHALANRIAINTMNYMPFYRLKNVFEVQAEWRLYRSFTKRLSYLHYSEKAQEFAVEWVSNSETLKDLSNLDEKKMHLLECIAPLNIELTLDILERVTLESYADKFFSRENPLYYRLSRLLVHLAYSVNHFERTIKLLVKLALTEEEGEKNNSIRSDLKGIFNLYLSHTHATLNQRIEVVNNLIYSSDQKEKMLAINLLKALLEAHHFSSWHLSNFGGHVRNFGYTPSSGREVEEWYMKIARYCLKLISDRNMNHEISIILADSLRGIWSWRNCFRVVETICEEMAEKDLWIEGWLSIKSILFFDRKKMDDRLIKRLELLEERLRPSSLEEQLQIFLTTNQYYSKVLIAYKEDVKKSNLQTVNSPAPQILLLGKSLSEREDLLSKYMSKLINSENTYLGTIAVEMTKNFSDHTKLWKIIREELQMYEAKGFHSPFLVGCISRFNDELINVIYKELFDLNYIKSIVTLQNYLFQGLKGVDRLTRLINDKKLPRNYIINLQNLHFNDEITPQVFFELLKSFQYSYDDNYIIIHFLHDLVYNKVEKFLNYEPIRYLMHESLLNIFSSEIKSGMVIGYECDVVIKFVYNLAEAKGKYTDLLAIIFEGLQTSRIYEFYIDGILESLVTVRPYDFLEETYQALISNKVSFSFLNEPNPLSHISFKVFKKWIEEVDFNEQCIRVKVVLSNVKLYKRTGGVYKWSELGEYILSRFYKNEDILNDIEYNLFSLTSLRDNPAGSTANNFEERRSLIVELFELERQELSNWAKTLNAKLIINLEQLRRKEIGRDRNLENFEY